ncbi:ubiquitin domain-containing protein 1 [Bicyclus anynana]|uniref:Ubiquitin domain-containing protein 1 n=1 Tax=Bicyclus anynana TaxID=110368 RepID=A0A6J1MMF5_BICAN|nr:ubiquitin domain-containing protein 1 [Bicyclus anynana]
MGGCIGITRSRSGPIEDSSGTVSRPNSGGLRKNQSLCHETIRWKSDVPLTEGQLRSKRDEFWDTAPAFEGRKEIWDALRAAAVAAEATDFQLAQAILDGASVSVPNGYLTECYDDWGTRYQVPIYCLSAPINMVKEASGRDSPAECSEPVDGGAALALRLRLSTGGPDLDLPVCARHTIAHCKAKLHAQENISPWRQRWFYGGKLLGDKLLVEEARITAGYVVQVIVADPEPRPPS